MGNNKTETWEIIASESNVLTIQTPDEKYICEIVADNEADLLNEADWRKAKVIRAAPAMVDLLIQNQWVLADIARWVAEGTDKTYIIAALNQLNKDGKEILNTIAED